MDGLSVCTCKNDGNHPIRWQGKEYLLIGCIDCGGPIATEEQYANFSDSTAQFNDGIIRQYGKEVGTRDDIEFVNRD